MENIYENFARPDYKLQEEIVNRYLIREREIVIADIGANNGSQIYAAATIAPNCTFYAVEPDENVLPELRALTLPSGEIQVFGEGAKEFLNRRGLRRIKMVLCGATLHHIYMTEQYLGQNEAVKQFLAGCLEHMETGGIFIVTDRYYDPTATQEEVEASRKAQFDEIGHADDRCAFIPSDMLRRVAEQLGLKLVEAHEQLCRGAARRYFYVHVYVVQ